MYASGNDQVTSKDDPCACAMYLMNMPVTGTFYPRKGGDSAGDEDVHGHLVGQFEAVSVTLDLHENV